MTIDTKEFRDLLTKLCIARTKEAVDTAEKAFIAHIDAHVTAQLAASRAAVPGLTEENLWEIHGALRTCGKVALSHKVADAIRALATQAAPTKQVSEQDERALIRIAIDRALTDTHIEDGTTEAYNAVMGNIEREVLAAIKGTPAAQGSGAQAEQADWGKEMLARKLAASPAPSAAPSEKENQQ